MPALAVALHSHSQGVVAVFAVDFVDGLAQARLLFSIHSVEKIALNGRGFHNVPHQHTGFFVMIHTIGSPRQAEHIHGIAHQFVEVGGRHGR